MGLIEIIENGAAEIKALRASPGPIVVMKGKALGGIQRELPVYQHHGFRSRPVDGTRGISVQLGEGSRERVVIATENYTINIALEPGGTAIYSTNAAGVEQAKMVLAPDGGIVITGGNVKITGGEVEIDGTVTPATSGPFNCLTACVFSGAVHAGKKVSGT